MKKVAITMALCFFLTGCGDANDTVETYKKLKEAESEVQELRQEIQELKTESEDKQHELDKYKNASKTMYD